MTLAIGALVLILVLVVGGFGGIYFKKSKNAKLCQGGYYCVLIGPDRVWMKVLPAKNGLIVKPEGDNVKKFYKKNEPEIPWATNGYIVPKEGPVPTIPYPVEASSSTQVSVGMLIYHVGCAMPLGYDEEGKFCGYGKLIGAAPEVIGATYKSQDTMDLFNDSANDNPNTPVVTSKFNIVNILTLVGVAAIIILCILIYVAVTGGIGDLKNGFGL